jgi:hypothetical protein
MSPQRIKQGTAGFPPRGWDGREYASAEMVAGGSWLERVDGMENDVADGRMYRRKTDHAETADECIIPSGTGSSTGDRSAVHHVAWPIRLMARHLPLPHHCHAAIRLGRFACGPPSFTLMVSLCFFSLYRSFYLGSAYANVREFLQDVTPDTTFLHMRYHIGHNLHSAYGVRRRVPYRLVSFDIMVRSSRDQSSGFLLHVAALVHHYRSDSIPSRYAGVGSSVRSSQRVKGHHHLSRHSSVLRHASSAPSRPSCA